jgi:hypothetical protein
MSCSDNKSLITRHVSGELSPAEREKLERHLSGCPACQAELLLAESIEGLLKKQPLIHAPLSLKARVMQATGEFEKLSFESVVARVARYWQKTVFWDEISSLGTATAAVIVIAILFGSWDQVIPDALSKTTSTDVIKNFMMVLGAKNGGVNFTYINPFLVFLSISFGLASTFGLMRRLRLRRVAAYLRVW